MIFFDTSALVPLVVEGHEHSVRSRQAFHAARDCARSCSQHSLAEVFNTLTKFSSMPRVTPQQALVFLRYVTDGIQVVPLEPADYMAVLAAMAEMNFSGALIYDALLLQAARKVNAETIYTWNVRHFQRLAPDMAARIRTP